MTRDHIFEQPGERQDWETPRDFFACLAKEIAFDLDVCATKANTKCARFYSRKDDGLAQPWAATNWMNPPYGREVTKWVEKAHCEAALERVTVALLPARVDTRWYHFYIARPENDVVFLKGRLTFHGAPDPAKFPSMLVVFGADLRPQLTATLSGALGAWYSRKRAK